MRLQALNYYRAECYAAAVQRTDSPAVLSSQSVPEDKTPTQNIFDRADQLRRESKVVRRRKPTAEMTSDDLFDALVSHSDAVRAATVGTSQAADSEAAVLRRVCRLQQAALSEQLRLGAAALQEIDKQESTLPAWDERSREILGVHTAVTRGHFEKMGESAQAVTEAIAFTDVLSNPDSASLKELERLLPNVPGPDLKAVS